MSAIAVTGPRQLTPTQYEQAFQDLTALATDSNWHVGDASGLDALAIEVGHKQNAHVTLYRKKQNLPYRAQGAERSTRMIKALAAVGGTLHAWPNKSAPLELQPSRSWPKGAAGSGTWGTIALAVGLDCPVVLHPLSAGIQLPAWLTAQQLNLI